MTDNKLNDNLIDVEDYRRVLKEVLSQAINDYIKLQHPKYRRKNFVKDAFETAVDLFFDPTFQMEHLTDEEASPLDLKGLIEQSLEIKVSDVSALQQHVIKAAKEFWEQQRWRAIFIPKMICIEGHVYDVIWNRKEESSSIDFESKCITLNAKDKYTAQKEMLQLNFVILNHIKKLGLTDTQMQSLGEAWFELLKVNDAFRYPPKEVLIRK